MANIKQIKLTNNTVYDIVDAGAARGNARIFYGTCSTEAATADKVVVCTSYNALQSGDIVIVKFDNTNTAAVANLTLNVNNTGAVAIKKQYNSSVANLNAVGELRADTIAEFIYNGTNWILTNADYNNSYSSMSTTEAWTGTATTARSMTAAGLKATLANLGGDGLTLTHDATSGIRLDLDTATTTAIGGVKIGNNINISSGVISVSTATSAQNGIVTTGAQTFSGDKAFYGDKFYLYGMGLYLEQTEPETTSSLVAWFPSNTTKYGDQAYAAAVIRPSSITDSSGNYIGGQLVFRINSYVSTGDPTPINKGEYYRLPAPAADMTSNVYYQILTSKAPVTIAQGGTNATTTVNAVNNLLGTGTAGQVLMSSGNNGVYWATLSVYDGTVS